MQFTELDGMQTIMAAYSDQPAAMLVVADKRRQILTWTEGGTKAIEDKIEIGFDGPARGPINTIRRVQDQIYVASGRRGICKRDDQSQWNALCPAVAFPKDIERSAASLTQKDDIMLIASPLGAAYRQNGEWTLLFETS